MIELLTGQRANRTTSSVQGPPEPLSRFCPHRPWPRQQVFLELDCLEAFYGGAAAGGKSEALLMAALQFVHVPGYSALILRRDTQRLNLSGGLIPRSHEWLAGTGAVWNAGDRRWTFPSADGQRPATLSFGYLMDSQDRWRYGSSEFQYIAFDELTEFPEEDYLFLFSRLRKTVDLEVPLRMRAASNPGNVGHHWVRQRFISETALRESRESDGAAVYHNNEIAFVPARIRDNPAVDEAEYTQSLMHLPPVVRQRLMFGDWSVSQSGLIQETWLRYYTIAGHLLHLMDRDDRVITAVDERDCRRFATIDPAGTSADRARERRGRSPSWSVIAVWDLGPARHHSPLMLRHIWRARASFDQLCHALREVHRAWRPARMLIENERLGQAAVDVLGRELPLSCTRTEGKDKVARAAHLLTRLEAGGLFLPHHHPGWLADLEAEWVAWTGLDDETTDQIDVAAYAAIEAARQTPTVVQGTNIFWRP